MFAKIIAAIFGSTKAQKPEDLNDILEGFNTQIQKMKARVEFDEQSIEDKKKEQLRLEMEKQVLEGDVAHGKRLIVKFSDLIA